MKKYATLPILCFCVVSSFAAAAGEPQPSRSTDDRVHISAEDKRMAVSVGETLGALELFVQKKEAKFIQEEPSPESLNSLIPSAGVQLRFQF